MKPKLIIVEKDSFSNLILTKEELQEIIDQVYDEGFEEGKKSNGTLTVGTPYNINLTGGSTPRVLADDIKYESHIDDILEDIRNHNQ